jgi:hypothetical protein
MHLVLRIEGADVIVLNFCDENFGAWKAGRCLQRLATWPIILKSVPRLALEDLLGYNPAALLLTRQQAIRLTSEGLESAESPDVKGIGQ